MAGYIGTKAAVSSPGAERKKVFSITTTTTSLTGLAYTPGFVHVYHNGVRLVDGTDYTATNGTSITLTTAAQNGDEVVVISFATFQVADAYTKAESDDRYVNVAGDTMTGDLTVQADIPNVIIESTNAAGEAWKLQSTYNNTGGAYGSFQVRDEANNIWMRFNQNNGSDQIELRTTNTDRLTIDSSGNVGIGTSSPSEILNVVKSSTAATHLKISNSNGSILYGLDGNGSTYAWQDSGAGNFYTGTNGSGQLIMYSGGGERARIDASGNLLVGKTSDTYSVAGASIRANPSGVLSGATVTRDGANVVSLNRLTSDGDILTFSKDTTTVGSIGNAGANVYFAQSSKGVGVSSARIYPVTSSGSVSDNTMDLGNFDARWQDLYLSGGVYLGGTGAANYLDDYEDGTWTPTVTASSSNPSVTYSQNTGYYTKVGNLVCVTCFLQLSSFSGGSGVVYVSGLPFSSTNAVSSHSSIQNEYQYLTMPGDANTVFTRLNPNSASLQFEFLDTRAGAVVINRGALTVGGVGSQFRLIASYTYRTS